MRIFLIGLTGCGKSTIAKQLAQKLNTKFVDLDDYIILNQQMSIAEIFAEKGESYFRQLENQSIKELIKEKDIVISTGGGAPCFHDNIAIMNVAGITIFLDVPVSEITNRLWNTPNRENRPLIKGKKKDELFAYLDGLRTERLPFYKEAKLVMHGATITIDQILMLLEHLD